MKYPKGFKKGDVTQLAVRFPNELFKQLVAMAKKEKKDFNAMVIELAKLGKFDLDESDKHEAA